MPYKRGGKITTTSCPEHECLPWASRSCLLCGHFQVISLFCDRSFPIAKALDLGADVVVTGRCVDSALTLGPLIHKVSKMTMPLMLSSKSLQFGWTVRDLDQLAAGRFLPLCLSLVTTVILLLAALQVIWWSVGLKPPEVSSLTGIKSMAGQYLASNLQAYRYMYFYLKIKN